MMFRGEVASSKVGRVAKASKYLNRVHEKCRPVASLDTFHAGFHARVTLFENTVPFRTDGSQSSTSLPTYTPSQISPPNPHSIKPFIIMPKREACTSNENHERKQVAGHNSIARNEW